MIVDHSWAACGAAADVAMALAALDGVKAIMDEISEHAWIISIVGDFLTLFGAYWTARAVILTKQQADEISSVPYGGSHPKHSAALLDQSKAARAGLVCVAVGAGFQIVSKLIEEFLTG